MEKNKKESNTDHVKIYDKYMYVSQEKLKSVILIISVFLIGFITGYFAKESIDKNTDNINNSVNSGYNTQTDT